MKVKSPKMTDGNPSPSKKFRTTSTSKIRTDSQYDQIDSLGQPETSKVLSPTLAKFLRGSCHDFWPQMCRSKKVSTKLLNCLHLYDFKFAERVAKNYQHLTVVEGLTGTNNNRYLEKELSFKSLQERRLADILTKSCQLKEVVEQLDQVPVGLGQDMPNVFEPFSTTDVKAVSVSGNQLSTLVNPDDEYPMTPFRKITGKISSPLTQIRQNSDQLTIPFVEVPDNDVILFKTPVQTYYKESEKPSQTSNEQSILDRGIDTKSCKPTLNVKKLQTDQRSFQGGPLALPRRPLIWEDCYLSPNADNIAIRLNNIDNLNNPNNLKDKNVSDKDSIENVIIGENNNSNNDGSSNELPSYLVNSRKTPPLLKTLFGLSDDDLTDFSDDEGEIKSLEHDKNVLPFKLNSELQKPLVQNDEAPADDTWSILNTEQKIIESKTLEFENGFVDSGKIESLSEHDENGCYEKSATPISSRTSDECDSEDKRKQIIEELKKKSGDPNFDLEVDDISRELQQPQSSTLATTVSEPSIFDVGADKSQKVPNPKRSSPRDNLPDENLLTPEPRTDFEKLLVNMKETRVWFTKAKKPASATFQKTRSKQVNPIQIRTDSKQVNPPQDGPDFPVHLVGALVSTTSPFAPSERDAKSSYQQKEESTSSPHIHRICSNQKSAKDYPMSETSRHETSSSPQHLQVPNSSYQEKNDNISITSKQICGNSETDQKSKLFIERGATNSRDLKDSDIIVLQNQDKVSPGTESGFIDPAESSWHQNVDKINKFSLKPANPINQMISKLGHPFISIGSPSSGNDVSLQKQQHCNSNNNTILKSGIAFTFGAVASQPSQSTHPSQVLSMNSFASEKSKLMGKNTLQDTIQKGSRKRRKKKKPKMVPAKKLKRKLKKLPINEDLPKADSFWSSSASSDFIFVSGDSEMLDFCVSSDGSPLDSNQKSDKNNRKIADENIELLNSSSLGQTKLKVCPNRPNSAKEERKVFQETGSWDEQEFEFCNKSEKDAKEREKLPNTVTDLNLAHSKTPKKEVDNKNRSILTPNNSTLNKSCQINLNDREKLFQSTSSLSTHNQECDEASHTDNSIESSSILQDSSVTEFDATDSDSSHNRFDPNIKSCCSKDQTKQIPSKLGFSHSTIKDEDQSKVSSLASEVTERIFHIKSGFIKTVPTSLPNEPESTGSDIRTPYHKPEMQISENKKPARANSQGLESDEECSFESDSEFSGFADSNLADNIGEQDERVPQQGIQIPKHFEKVPERLGKVPEQVEEVPEWVEKAHSRIEQGDAERGLVQFKKRRKPDQDCENSDSELEERRDLEQAEDNLEISGSVIDESDTDDVITGENDVTNDSSDPQFSEDSDVDEDNEVLKKGRMGFDPMFQDYKDASMEAYNSLKDVCFEFLSQGSCSNGDCRQNHKPDSDAILNYFLVVKHARLLKWNKIELPISACDKIGNFVNIYEVHQAKMAAEERLKLMGLIFEDLTQDKKNLDLLEFIKFFEEQFWTLYPGHFKIRQIFYSEHQVLAETLKTFSSLIIKWILSSPVNSSHVLFLVDLHFLAFEGGIVLDPEARQQTADVLTKLLDFERVSILMEYWSFLPQFRVNSEILNNLLDHALAVHHPDTIRRLSLILSSQDLKELEQKVDSSKLKFFIENLCSVHLTPEFLNHLRQSSSHVTVGSILDQVLSSHLASRTWLELGRIVAAIPVSHTREFAIFTRTYYEAVDRLASIKSQIQLSDSEVGQSFENLISNYLRLVAPNRLVPVQILFFSQLAATFLARYNGENPVDRTRAASILKFSVHLELEPWNYDSLNHNCPKKTVLLKCVDLFSVFNPRRGFELMTANEFEIRENFGLDQVLRISKNLIDQFLEFRSVDPFETEWILSSMRLFRNWISPILLDSDDSDSSLTKEFRTSESGRLFNRVIREATKSYMDRKNGELLMTILNFVSAQRDVIDLEEGTIRGLVFMLHKESYEKDALSFYNLGQDKNFYAKPEISESSFCLQVPVHLTYNELVVGLSDGLEALANVLGEDQIDNLLKCGESLNQRLNYRISCVRPQKISSNVNLPFSDFRCVSSVKDACKRILLALPKFENQTIFQKYDQNQIVLNPSKVLALLKTGYQNHFD